MSQSFGPVSTEGPYLNPDLYFPTDQSQFLEVLYNRDFDVANLLNIKENALYDLTEIVTAQLWFTAGEPQIKRQTFRTVVNFGALPNTGLKAIPHNIPGITASSPSTFTFTKIYGCATNPIAGPDPARFAIPLPYVSVINPPIELYVTSTNVVVVTNADYTAFTTCVIVVEYLKN